MNEEVKIYTVLQCILIHTSRSKKPFSM